MFQLVFLLNYVKEASNKPVDDEDTPLIAIWDNTQNCPLQWRKKVKAMGMHLLWQGVFEFEFIWQSRSTKMWWHAESRFWDGIQQWQWIWSQLNHHDWTIKINQVKVIVNIESSFLHCWDCQKVKLATYNLIFWLDGFNLLRISWQWTKKQLCFNVLSLSVADGDIQRPIQMVWYVVDWLWWFKILMLFWLLIRHHQGHGRASCHAGYIRVGNYV